MLRTVAISDASSMVKPTPVSHSQNYGAVGFQIYSGIYVIFRGTIMGPFFWEPPSVP